MEERVIQGELHTEYAQGCVQCSQCDYWDMMDGFIKPEDTKFIYFVCPQCEAVERVANPLI